MNEARTRTARDQAWGSEAAEVRQRVYDQAVEALHRVNPKAVPVASPDDPCAIPRVVEQARRTAPPQDAAPSPECMLHSRVRNMQGAVAELVAKAKRKGIAAELPAADEGGDLGARLQMFNAAHDKLERQIAYFDTTTKEQRAIDGLCIRIERLGKRVDTIAAALAALQSLLPLLMKADEKWGLLPIEWVIFRNSDVMAVFDDDTLADRWSLLGVAPRRDECARRPD
jgi:hypothetical protein